MLNSLSRLSWVVFICVAGAACAGPDASEQSATADPPELRLPDGAEALSFLGEALYPADGDAEVRARQEEQLAEAMRAYDQAPDDMNALIWVGRRQGYLQRYRAAIETYTAGIERAPDMPHLFRHRGHRNISVRDLDAAIADFERAAELIAGTEDETEPDGQPNAAGIPTSTLHYNIWYHLGLAYYLNNDLENAARAYEECLAVSKNNDALVATSHWYYMTLKRLGRDEEAMALLEPITADMEIIENASYHHLILLYKGLMTEAEIMQGTDGTPSGASIAYGVANWHVAMGHQEVGEEQMMAMLDGGGNWAGFGFIAAEADIARWSSH